MQHIDWLLKSLATIRMNEICLAWYGQKLNFLFGNRDKDKHKPSEKKRRRLHLNNFFKKVVFMMFFNHFLFVIIHK